MKKERVRMTHDWVPLRDALEDPAPSTILRNGEEAILHYEEFRKHNRIK